MSTAIERMLQGYVIENIYDKKNAMKEVIQEIVLCGLSRAGFFKKTAFYGGTALRIFYGLDRFSEDLDFSLMHSDETFTLADYFSVLQDEVNSFGLQVVIEEKDKTHESNIKSAFLKGNTKEHILLFYADSKAADAVAKNEVIKVKFEVDINPPAYATFERKYRLLPAPYEVNMYDIPSLFAGKIHAVICRGWKNRVKGRDLYDYVFYMMQDSAVNLPHLQARLIDSGKIAKNDVCNIETVKNLLKEKFSAIDYRQAKEDVAPFIHDVTVLDMWNADFFQQITDGLRERK